MNWKALAKKLRRDLAAEQHRADVGAVTVVVLHSLLRTAASRGALSVSEMYEVEETMRAFVARKDMP